MTSGCPTVLQMFWKCGVFVQGWRVENLLWWVFEVLKSLESWNLLYVQTNCSFFVLHEKIMNQKPWSSNIIFIAKLCTKKPWYPWNLKTIPLKRKIHLNHPPPLLGFYRREFCRERYIYKTIWFAKKEEYVSIFLEPSQAKGPLYTKSCAAFAT